MYVDDLVLVGKRFKMIKEMKQSLSDRFKMQDLGQLHHPRNQGSAEFGRRKGVDWAAKLCSEDAGEVRYAGLKTHEHTFYSRQQARQEDN